MSRDDDEELLELARIKDTAQDRLFRRVDFTLRIARVIYGLLFVVVCAAIWLAALQWQVKDNRRDIDRNRRAMEIVWEHYFATPMPP